VEVNTSCSYHNMNMVSILLEDQKVLVGRCDPKWIQEPKWVQEGLKIKVLRIALKRKCMYALSLRTQHNLNGLKRTPYAKDIAFCSFFQT
jgi:hypothetical protein